MALDIDDLLRPIAEGAPCGEEVRYDPAFDELHQAVQPQVEYEKVGGKEVARQRSRDWPKIRRDGLVLARRGHDLRLMVLLLRGLVGTDGIEGARDGLRLIRTSLERYWDTLHPGLDSAESDPAEQAFHRLNCLKQLGDGEGLVAELRRAPLAAARGLGALSLRDLDLAAGRAAPAADERAPDAGLVQAVFTAADPAELAARLEAIGEAQSELERIEAVLAERLGGTAAVPDLDHLRLLLRTMRARIAERMPGAAPDAEPAALARGNGADGAPGPAPAVRGGAPSRLDTREDVVRALDLVLDYYRRQEPSSPIPLLVERTKKLVPMSFLELIEDLAPSGVKQIKEIGGLEKPKGG